MKKALIFLLFLYTTRFIIAGFKNPTDFLQMTLPPKYLAAGKTFCAYSSGVDSLWCNPAGLIIKHQMEFSLTGMHGLDAINYISGSSLIPLKQYGNLGLGAAYMGSPDELLVNADGNYVSDTSLSFNNWLITAGYAQKISDLHTGLNIKYIRNRMGLDNKNLLLVDAGLIMKFNFTRLYKRIEENLSIGMCIKDMGVLKYPESRFGIIQAGIDYKIAHSRYIESALCSDLSSYSFTDINASVGSRFNFYQLVSVYIGIIPYEMNILSLGCGTKIKFKKWCLKAEYAFKPSLNDFPVMHVLQVTILPFGNLVQNDL